MGKKNRKQATAPQQENGAPPTEQTEAAAPQQTAPAAIKFCNVKAGQKFRGKRETWYNRVMAFNGKPVADLVADLEANRPSVMGAKSQFSGTPEGVRGWVRFFERTGVLTYTDQAPV